MKFALVLALLLLAVAVSNTDAWLVRVRVGRVWRRITRVFRRVVTVITRPVAKVIVQPYVNTVTGLLAKLGIKQKQPEQGMCNVNTFMLSQRSSNICSLFKNVNYITTSENTPLLLDTFQNFLLNSFSRAILRHCCTMLRHCCTIVL